MSCHISSGIKYLTVSALHSYIFFTLLAGGGMAATSCGSMLKRCSLTLSWAKPIITVHMLCKNKVLCVAGKRS